MEDERWDTAKYLSTVERYRRGEAPEEWRYDLADPLDRAIWTALQAYLDYMETAQVELGPPAGAGAGAPWRNKEDTVYGSRGTRSLSRRQPRELEDRMLELRDVERGKKTMTEDERLDTAIYIFEGISAPAQALSGRPVAWGKGEYRIRRNFWEDGARALEELEGDTERPEAGLKPQEHGPWPPSLTRVAQEHPILFPERLAPLYGLLEKNLGPLVSQSDAARRLGLTPRGMALRLEREGMKRIRVGQYVFVLEKDVEAAEERQGLQKSASARGGRRM